MEIAVRPLDAPFGAEVIGLRDPAALDDAAAAALREAWKRYSLLLFRDLTIDPEQQLELAAVFGEVSQQGENHKRTGAYGFISNVVEGGNAPIGELPFHMDHCFYPKPLRGLTLYAIDVPSSGGDTVFSNGALAFDLLPSELRVKAGGLRALHVHDYAQKAYVGRIREAEIPPEAPRAAHPVAFPHPLTGKPILYVCRRHTDRILDVPTEESEALLEELIPYSHRPEVVYRHAWRPSDLVVWDNIALQHARTEFDPAEKRTLRRVQIS